jgi:outer membrane immunogenic protein
MRRLVVASVAAAGLGVGLTVPASAADLSRPAPAYAKAPAIAPAPSWTGCYGGIEGGGMWGKESVQQAGTGIPVTNDLTPSGGLAGGTLGCNYQMNMFVVGVEDDLSWTGFSATGADVSPFNPLFSSKVKTTWLDTLRARAGVTFGPGLYYVTGGAAFTDINDTDIGVVDSVSIKNTATGWTVGAGAEWMIPSAPQWSVKAEYLYADFGSRTDNFNAIEPLDTNISTHLKENIVRAGVNYRFW